VRPTPSFRANDCASKGARSFTSVLSKKHKTSRGFLVGGACDICTDNADVRIGC
jgi:hypothetical protein